MASNGNDQYNHLLCIRRCPKDTDGISKSSYWRNHQISLFTKLEIHTCMAMYRCIEQLLALYVAGVIHYVVKKVDVFNY